MASQDVLIKKGILERRGGVVVFDLARYQMLERELEKYRQKEKALRKLKNFENLAQWGRDFAKKRNITQKQVLADD